MAYTQADLDALLAAKASGITRMTYDGKTVEYRTMDELDRAIAAVQQDLNGNNVTRTRRVLLSSRRGL